MTDCTLQRRAASTEDGGGRPKKCHPLGKKKEVKRVKNPYTEFLTTVEGEDDEEEATEGLMGGLKVPIIFGV